MTRQLLIVLFAFGSSLIHAADPPKVSSTAADNVRDCGSRRELFVDRYLIDRMVNTSLKLHEPQLAAPLSEPADNLEYGTVIKEGDLFRLYTRDGRGAKFDGDRSEVTRYCESRDGIHWTKPKLGLVEINGSKENNVILQEAPFCHNFSPMLDTRPGVPAETRFKALAGTVKSGLVAFVSGDGIHWRKLRPVPVITYTKEYAFDSQNVSFWSELEQCYVCYFRHFLDKKLRSVCRTTSADFVTWTEPVPLKPNFPGEHLYTTLTHPYFRAPHLYIATPTRFHPQRGESTDILFMTARGPGPFDRTFREAFIRPGLDPNRWGNRSNYAALNVVPTGPTEMSIYATPFRRFVLRLDGFASVHAGADSGEMRTHPIRFSGNRLFINYSTSAGGSLRVEIQDLSGKPLPGFALADCRHLVGDSIEQTVKWTPTSDLSSLSGKPVRLRFVMQEGDLFALQFRTDQTVAKLPFEGRTVGDTRIDNSLKLGFAWCPAGNFRMGSPASERDRNGDEDAVNVVLSRGFWMGKLEVPQGAWQSVMGTTPWKGEKFVREGAEYPATNICFEDISEFLRKVNASERAAGRLPTGWTYDLPTEAQWEYACRAGTQTRFSFGDDDSLMKDYAWYGGIVGTGSATGQQYAHPGGLKKPNPWGLYDMHGNVWEWCRDVKLDKLTGGTDPFASSGRRNRVIRAGSWRDAPSRCRSAYRYGVTPDHRKYYIGFRLAIVPAPGQ